MTDSRVASDLYLDLLKLVLTRAVFEDNDHILEVTSRAGIGVKGRVKNHLIETLGRRDVELVKKRPYDAAIREEGRDWPARAETMVGVKRLDNLKFCIETSLRDGVPGDLVETGVWRGGAAIFMRAVLKAHEVTDRTVWVADSFEGLPPPDESRYPADAGDRHHTYDALAIGVEQVRSNFRRYGLLDDQVEFLQGWFADTLPTAPIERISVLRLDGDMYSSTIQAIEALYPKLSSGGFCIVDDYGAVEACREAITDYRSEHGISTPIEWIDWTGAFWRKA